MIEPTDGAGPVTGAVCTVDGVEVVVAAWGAETDNVGVVNALDTFVQEVDPGEPPELEDWYIDDNWQGPMAEGSDGSSIPFVFWGVEGLLDLDRTTAVGVARSIDASGESRDQQSLREWWEAHRDLLADAARVPVASVGLVVAADAQWTLYDGGGLETSFSFGEAGDRPVMGDWDCDGIDTPGVFRPTDSSVHLRNSNSSGIADLSYFVGSAGDIPLAGDFNGDGCDSVSLYRPSTQEFLLFDRLPNAGAQLGAAATAIPFGNPGDQPVVGDWNGDGKDGIGVYRDVDGAFVWRSELGVGPADGQTNFGDRGDLVVVGDWDGVDGVDTPAVYRPSTGYVYFRHSLDDGPADDELYVGSGSSAIPVAGSVS